MLDNTETTSALHADIDALRERCPRTADLYREACALMFFRYGQTPTTNSLYQLVRKGSMSVPAEALKRFWSDLRERARVDLQHADVPDQLKESAGRLVGEIWTLARQAADESMAELRQSATVERDAVLEEKNRLEDDIDQLSSQLEDVRTEIASAERTIVKQRDKLNAVAAAQQETELRLKEARANNETLREQISSISRERAAEIEKLTDRVLQAEQRYTDLAKRTLVDLDRERTAATRLQKQLDAERRTYSSRIEEIQSDAQRAQVQLARQGQELGAYMTKAELLADERDRAASQAMKIALQCGELENQLAAERARVAELRGQLERFASTFKSRRREPQSTSIVSRQRRRASGKPDD